MIDKDEIKEMLKPIKKLGRWAAFLLFVACTVPAFACWLTVYIVTGGGQ